MRGRSDLATCTGAHSVVWGALVFLVGCGASVTESVVDASATDDASLSDASEPSDVSMTDTQGDSFTEHIGSDGGDAPSDARIPWDGPVGGDCVRFDASDRCETFGFGQTYECMYDASHPNPNCTANGGVLLPPPYYLVCCQ